MKEWFSLSEIAGSLDMPAKVSGVRRKAERECWQVRDRQAVGGGKEYHISSLPSQTQAWLQNKFAGDLPLPGYPDPIATSPAVAPDLSLELTIIDQPKTETLSVLERTTASKPSDPKDQTAQARMEIIKLWRRHVAQCKAAGGLEVGCDLQFVEQARSGKIQFTDAVHVIDDWIVEALSSNGGKIKVSRATLKNWEKTTDLRTNHKGKEGQDFFSLRPGYGEACEAVLVAYGVRATPKSIHYMFESGQIRHVWDIAPINLEVPTPAQTGKWLKDFKANNPALYKHYMTGDPNVLKASFGSLSEGKLPNDQWMLDSTLADLEIKTAKDSLSTTERWNLVACIDVATRRMKFLVTQTSKSEAILLLLYRCFTDWGIPKTIKTDNGKDYSSTWLQDTMIKVGINQIFCTPFTPQQKGNVERIFGTLQRSVEFTTNLPRRTGASVAERQAIRKRNQELLTEDAIALTPKQWQEWLDAWCNRYQNTYHESLKESPIQRLARFGATGWVPEYIRPEILLWLLRKEKEVTLISKGIRLNSRLYVAPELAGMQQGSKLSVRFDPNNPDEVEVFDSSDMATAKFICRAKWEKADGVDLVACQSASKKFSDQLKDQAKQATKRAKRLTKKIEANPELMAQPGEIKALIAKQQKDMPDAERLYAEATGEHAFPVTRTPEKVAELDALRLELAEKPKAVKVDYDGLLKSVLIRWRNQEEISMTDLCEASHYLAQSAGDGALFVFVENGKEYRAFKAWLSKQTAASNAAAQ